MYYPILFLDKMIEKKTPKRYSVFLTQTTTYRADSAFEFYIQADGTPLPPSPINTRDS